MKFDETVLKSIVLDVIEEIGGDRAFWSVYCQDQVNAAAAVLKIGINELIERAGDSTGAAE